MDKDKIFVVPAKGLTVINPATNAALPADGAEVDKDIYWVRRLNDGDVTEGKPAKGKKE